MPFLSVPGYTAVARAAGALALLPLQFLENLVIITFKFFKLRLNVMLSVQLKLTAALLELLVFALKQQLIDLIHGDISLHACVLHGRLALVNKAEQGLQRDTDSSFIGEAAGTTQVSKREHLALGMLHWLVI